MLSKRLEKLVDLLPRCGALADVGCDHGYVGIEALKRGVASKVVFADISNECLQKARKNCPAALQRNAEFVCQDGLGKIECDCAVVCGMGGLEILSILQGAEKLPKAVVLQPMRNVFDVRKYVVERYTVTYDSVIFDGKFYRIIVGVDVGAPTRKLSELEMEFGLGLTQEPRDDLADFLKHEKEKLQKILYNHHSDELEQKLKRLESALSSVLCTRR